jgi:hypothetical protein
MGLGENYFLAFLALNNANLKPTPECRPKGMFNPTRAHSTIDLSIIHYTNLVNYRHSGEGRNPAGLFNMHLLVSRVAGVCFLTGFRPSPE